MKRSRKVLSLILSLAFAMAMMIGMTVTANALEPVTYIGHDENGTPKTGTRPDAGGSGRNHGYGIRNKKEKRLKI